MIRFVRIVKMRSVLHSTASAPLSREHSTDREKRKKETEGKRERIKEKERRTNLMRCGSSEPVGETKRERERTKSDRVNE